MELQQLEREERADCLVEEVKEERARVCASVARGGGNVTSLSASVRHAVQILFSGSGFGSVSASVSVSDCVSFSVSVVYV